MAKYDYYSSGYHNPISKLYPDEPYFLIRAQDKLSSHAVMKYAELLDLHGLHTQAEEVVEHVDLIRNWQKANGEKVKLPD